MRRRLLRVFPLLVVAAVFGLVLPKIASYGDVAAELGRLSGESLAALIAVAALNVATFAPPWMAAFPGLGFRRAILLTQASTATASVVPGGEAVGAGFSVGILRAWGYSRGAIAAGLAVLTSLNLLTKVVFAVAAIVALLLTGGDTGPLGLLTAVGVAVAAAAVTVGVLFLRSDASARRLGELGGGLFERIRRLLRRQPGQPLADRLVHFRKETVGLLGRRGLSLAFWMLVGNLTVFLVLLVALRAVGISSGEINVVNAFAAWALVRLVTAIPITPGGIGIVELGLTGALVAAGGDQTEAVTAVLLYRAFTWLPPIVIGLPSLLLWRRAPA
ncbi:MAG TPA: lysylphosphatidylglycerol synthase transmembrane domain-containing protein [Gaiellaceae bacterium]|nr:lysylphosphatidylglycerol synthase transmembrane domain-containing protein [Gaiellaceae bacterium]